MEPKQLLKRFAIAAAIPAMAVALGACSPKIPPAVLAAASPYTGPAGAAERYRAWHITQGVLAGDSFRFEAGPYRDPVPVPGSMAARIGSPTAIAHISESHIAHGGGEIYGVVLADGGGWIVLVPRDAKGKPAIMLATRNARIDALSTGAFMREPMLSGNAGIDAGITWSARRCESPAEYRRGAGLTKNKPVPPCPSTGVND